MTETKEFYTSLFNEDDYIHYKNVMIKGDKKVFIPANASLQMLVAGPKPEYICLNAVDIESNGRATNSNIITYRTLLLEEDDTTPEIQKEKIYASGVPYSNLVFSGNSSVHCTISLQEGLESEDQYRAVFEAIAVAMKQYNYKADAACKNPSRLSRAAGGTNSKTNNPQDLLDSRGRVPNTALFNWLKQHHVKWEDYLPKPVEFASIDGPNTANDRERWEAVKKFVPESKDYDTAGDGEREPIRFRLSLKCKAVGLSEDLAKQYIASEFPSSEGDRKVYNEVAKNYKREVQPINVMSKEDWQEYQDRKKKKDYEEQFENLLNFEYSFEGGEEQEVEAIPEDFDSQLNRYVRIGDSIYMLANRKLHKRSLQSFTVHHSKRDLRHVNTYVDFCTEPGYINYQPIVNQHFNDFELPQWRARPGQWNTIEKYLRHITSNDRNPELQYQMMLDYFQLSLLNPKQKLPILVLLSYEKGTGKSTIFDLLMAMFGNNVGEVGPANFQLEWNSAWHNKHFIFVDEAEKIEDVAAVERKLKRSVYSKTIEVNRKGKDTYISNYWFGKFVIASNEESGFIVIDRYEDRYWILKVPPYEGAFDNEFVDKLKKEVPAFAHFLMHRQLHTQNEGRGWFNKELLNNDALQDIVSISRPQIEIDIDNVFTEWFELHKDKEECNFLIADLQTKMKGNYKQPDLKAALHRLYSISNQSKVLREDSFNGFEKRQRYFFTLSRGLFVTDSDMSDQIEASWNELSQL